MAVSFPSTFQAYVYESFGDPLTELKLRVVDQPPLDDDQVRIKVHAAAFNPADIMLVEAGLAFPLTKTSPTVENPFRIGFDVAGTVVEVGSNVNHLQLGDAAYGLPYFGKVGTLAEYVNVDASGVALKPKSLTFTQAASIPSTAITSYQALVQHGQVSAGDRVLVLGGSSACGAYGIQIAKSLGAHVIATTSTRNLELVRSLGADEVINYTTLNWADVIEQHSVDVIYSCVEPESWNDRAQQVLKTSVGKFVAVAFTEDPLIESPIAAEHIMVYAKPCTADLDSITSLIEAGKLVPVIDSVHNFEHFHEGLKVQMSKHARGKVVVQVVPDHAEKP